MITAEVLLKLEAETQLKRAGGLREQGLAGGSNAHAGGGRGGEMIILYQRIKALRQLRQVH